MLRWLLVASALAGCGRLQFDRVDGGALTSDAAAPDSMGDGSSVALACAATPISGVDYSGVGATTTRVIAAQVPDGFAVGLLMDGYSPLWGVHLDDQLVPDTSTPFKTTPAGSAGYVTGSMFWDGANLTGALDNGDGTLYLKTFAADMTTFNSADLRTGALGYPSVASTGVVTISFWHDGVTLYFNALQANGQPSGGDNSVGYATNIVATSAASGNGEVAVAVALADQTCELVSVTTSLGFAFDTLATSCASPSIIESGGAYTFAYESGGNVMAAKKGSPAVMIGPGSAPRLFMRGGEVLVAYRSGTTVKVARASDGTAATMTGMPSTVDAFDVAGSQVFAAAGSTPVVVSCP